MVTTQLFYDDLEIGMPLPVLRKEPTTQQLVKYAGASGDYYQIHYDVKFAKSNGLPGVILHGALKNAFLGELITRCIGDFGHLKKLSCQYRGMDEPGTPIFCKGQVTKKHKTRGENIIECDIWMENAEGLKTTPGTAIFSLPERPIEN